MITKQRPTTCSSSRKAKARKSSTGSTKPVRGTSASSQRLAKKEKSGFLEPGQRSLSGSDTENWSEGDDHHQGFTPIAESLLGDGRPEDSSNVTGPSKRQARASPVAGVSGAVAGIEGVSSTRPSVPGEKNGGLQSEEIQYQYTCYTGVKSEVRYARVFHVQAITGGWGSGEKNPSPREEIPPARFERSNFSGQVAADRKTRMRTDNLVYASFCRHRNMTAWPPETLFDDAHRHQPRRFSLLGVRVKVATMVASVQLVHSALNLLFREQRMNAQNRPALGFISRPSSRDSNRR